MTLVKNSAVYLLSNIINAVIPFLLLPVLTRYLTPSEYGQVAMFQMLISGLGAFVGLNAVGAANRKYYDSGCSITLLREFNGGCFQILIASTGVLFLIGFLFTDILVYFLSIPSYWIYAALMFSAGSFMISLRLGQWQIRGEAFRYGVLQISTSLLNMLLSLLFVVSLNFGSQGRVDGQVIAIGFCAIVATVSLYKDKLIKLLVWRPEEIKSALSFGVPLIPHIFGFFLLASVDRFVINQKLGLSYAGIYMVAVQVSSAFNIVFDAINKAFVPWLFETLKRDQWHEKVKVVRSTYIYFVLLIIVSPLPFILGPWLLVLIAGEEYRDAGKVIGWLCLGQIFGGMYLMVTNYIFYAKKTMQLSLVTISSGLLNVGLLFLLIESFGLQGAAMAFVLSKLIQFLGTWFLATQVVTMPWFRLNIKNNVNL